MAYKRDYSVVTVISNLTNSEAMNLKSKLIESVNKTAPKSKHFASTGNGSNVTRAITSYEKRRITNN